MSDLKADCRALLHDEFAAKDAEIERLRADLDKYILAIMTEGEKRLTLQAVVDAVRENGKDDPYFPHTKVGMMIAALKEADDD